MHKTEIGKIGEDIVCRFLMKQGYKILDRNYRKKWGEIDVVVEKKGKIHFIEVKSVSQKVSDETGYKPEDNVHSWKLQRLKRAIQTYLLENNVSDETDWQFDVYAVFIDFKNKKAKIRATRDVVL